MRHQELFDSEHTEADDTEDEGGRHVDMHEPPAPPLCQHEARTRVPQQHALAQTSPGLELGARGALLLPYGSRRIALTRLDARLVGPKGYLMVGHR